MTQEDKQLLLLDLCARVPYVTFVYVDWHETEDLEVCEDCEDEEDEPNIHTLISCNYYGECDLDDNLYKTIHDIKPYLRPMSSMTDEEEIEYERCFQSDDTTAAKNLIDFYNAHHFYYRGLIKKGLALEAPEDMYKS